MAPEPETTSLVCLHSAAVNVSHFPCWEIVSVGAPQNSSLPLLGWNSRAHRSGDTHCPAKITACQSSGAPGFPPVRLPFQTQFPYLPRAGLLLDLLALMAAGTCFADLNMFQRAAAAPL